MKVGENLQGVKRLGLLRVFLFPALGGLLFGYDIGATSFVLTQLQDDHSGVKWGHEVEDSSQLQGAIPAAGVFGALLGSMIVFKVADDLGRRRELLIGSFFYFVASIIEAAAANSSWDVNAGVTVLLLGRVLYGLGCGFSMHGAPAYIAEMSPPSVRGLLVSLKEAMIVLGILLGYLFGYAGSSTDGGWAYTYGVAAPLALIMGVGTYFLPPSCRWLALKGNMLEARNALAFVLSDGVDDAMNGIRDMVESEKTRILLRASEGQTTQPETQGVFSKKYRPALIAGIGLVVLQQVTGQPSVLYYANTIFSDAGLEAVATVGVGAFKLVATLAAVVTVDKYGRRRLLFIGISLMLVALITLTGAFYGYHTDDGDDDGDDDDDEHKAITARQAVILFAMFVYIGGYQIGFGPISWLMISEIFPLEVRGQAVSVSVQANFLFNLIVAYLFPVELDLIGIFFTFAIFAVIDAYALFFVFRYVPETKGLSLEEIERLLQSRVRASTIQHHRAVSADVYWKQPQLLAGEGNIHTTPLLFEDS